MRKSARAKATDVILPRLVHLSFEFFHLAGKGNGHLSAIAIFQHRETVSFG